MVLLKWIDWKIFYFALPSVGGSQVTEKNDQNKTYSLLQYAMKSKVMIISDLRIL